MFGVKKRLTQVVKKDYDYDNDPTYGQCAITASLVYDLFDGTIYKLKVDGGGTHYFK